MASQLQVKFQVCWDLNIFFMTRHGGEIGPIFLIYEPRLGLDAREQIFWSLSGQISSPSWGYGCAASPQHHSHRRANRVAVLLQKVKGKMQASEPALLESFQCLDWGSLRLFEATCLSSERFLEASAGVSPRVLQGSAAFHGTYRGFSVALRLGPRESLEYEGSGCRVT